MGKKRKPLFTFYKPRISLIGFDILLILFNICFIFLFLPLTTPEPFKKYALSLLISVTIWLVISYFFQRYKKLRSRAFYKQITSLFFVSVLVFALLGGYILLTPRSPYSENVLVTVLIGVFIVEYSYLFLYFAYRYATQYEIPCLYGDKRDNAVALPSEQLSDDAAIERKARIIESIGEKAFGFLTRNIKWDETGTLVLTEVKLGELTKVDFYRYSTVVQLKKLNNIRGINNMLSLINDKLPDDGIFVCCYESQNSYKKKIFAYRPKVFAYIYYTGSFIAHRIIPKLFLTRRLYYDITKGKKRFLSKTEVLGRLNYCGFSIMKEVKIDGFYYIIAKRTKGAISGKQRNYGVLIKLKRFGKNKKLFNVYKIRTMHPYAEFIQDYVYEKYSLASGGKFKNDMRIATAGRIFRKFWLDEIPMILNLFKGDMKIVGVRPLSQHFFSLYSSELQEKRTQHKPGLLPPYYVDMPKTLPEIEASEMKYLIECEKKGTFRTDIKYFFIILKNILIKKARSA